MAFLMNVRDGQMSKFGSISPISSIVCPLLPSLLVGYFITFSLEKLENSRIYFANRKGKIY
jgi:hypothetical protein